MSGASPLSQSLLYQSRVRPQRFIEEDDGVALRRVPEQGRTAAAIGHGGLSVMPQAS